ncbi:MAG: hypothetical protein WC761_05450 [Candidatus Paceibacterota bacterium]|jgi:hypothetical protein
MHKNSFLSVGVLGAIITLASPSFVFAAVNCEPPETINEVFGCFIFTNMTALIPVLVLVGLVTFLAGVVKFVRSGDNEESRKAGRDIMIYGIIVLFVMVSFWGFVGILSQTFFGRDAGIPNYLRL